MTPEKNGIEGRTTDKSSAGIQSFDSFDTRDNARRPSSRVPLYLRASTSSCHDICKHGRIHSSEEETRTRISKPLPLTTAVKPVKSKRPILGKFSSGCKLSAANHSDAESASLRQSVSSSGGSGNSPAKKCVSLRSQATIETELPVPIIEGKFVDKKRESIKAASTEKSKKGRQMLASALKDRSKVHMAEARTSNCNVPEKIVHAIETEADAKARPLSSEEVGDVKCTISTSESTLDDHLIIEPSLSSTPQSLSPSNVPPVLSRKDDDKGIACKDQKTEEFVSDDILVLGIDKAQPVRKKHYQAIVKINLDQSIDARGNPVSKKIVETPSMKEPRDKILTTRRPVLLEDKDKHFMPTKLKFRRGRVLNLQPLDHTVPKKLKFRRPVLIDTKPEDSASNKHESMKTFIAQPNKQPANNQKTVDLQSHNNSTRRLRLKMAREVGNENVSLRRRSSKKNNGSKDNAAAGSAEISSLKIRLRHQVVQNKVTEVLLNNVIEETASKLVKSRKSKVKALVGAFETVISLQELPPAQTE